MKRVLPFAAVLALACALVAGAAATTKPPKPKPKTTTTKAHSKPKPKAKPKPKPQTFDKRFSCATALPLSFLNAQYVSSGWSDGVTVKTVPGDTGDHVYPPNGTSSCEYAHPNGEGGNLIILYGPGAAKSYNSDIATAKVRGAQACKPTAANPQPPTTDPRWCGPVTVSGFGGQAYESFSYIAVLRGDVFVSFEAGEKLVDGQYMGGGGLVPPTSLLENVMHEVLSKLPAHS